MRKVLLLLAFPLFSIAPSVHAQFCPGAAPWVFDDVPVGDLFCGYITWAAQNGITLGCAIIDANHRLYCPNDAVTRSQMAAFVNRLGNVRVEAVGTGPGLTGGPITGIGTINLAATNLLPTTPCANNQIARWNGSAWVCSNDANSGGTVTSVGSGTGLTGGPVTTTGSLSIASGYQLPQGCTNGQVAKSNGSNAWTCANDANSAGTVTSVATGAGLTGGPITATGTVNLASTQLLPTVPCATNQVARWNGSAWVCATPTTGLTAYGSFSNDDGPVIAVIIGGTSIPLPDTSVAFNTSIGGAVVTLATAGTYRFHYCIRTTANLLASSRLVINGTAINASIISPVLSRSEWCRDTMLSLISTNSTVQIQLFGILGVATLLSPGGAELVIERLNP